MAYCKSKVLRIGTTFDSFDAVLTAMKLFEAEQKVSYWRRDSRTIKAAQKRGTSVSDNVQIKYFEIKYACVKGGREYKSKSTGKRPNQSTFREECPSFVHLRVSTDAQRLVVVNLNCTHNHSASKEAYQLLPKCRRLNEEQTSVVNQMLKTKPNKRDLQHYVRSTYGKQVTLRDIKNLSAKMRGCPQNLEDILKGICERPDLTVEIVTDDTVELRAIYYQDAVMQRKFADYPELLMANVTYKLDNPMVPIGLFLQIVVDGNGDSEIVSVFVIVNEDHNTLKCLLELFQKYNPAWERICTVLTDRGMTERKVYQELMPDAVLHLCLFQVLKIMRREIHCEKMGICLEEKQKCLEIIQAMAFSRTEEEYASNHQRLRDTGIQPVVEYIENSWHKIRNEWVVGLKESCHYKNNTTNRIESINQKLKQVVEGFSNLETFFRNLELFISCLRQERDSQIANVLNKRPVCRFPDSSPESRYSKLLTSHAYQIVINQMSLASNVEVPVVDDVRDHIDLQTSHGAARVTANTCSCKFVLYNRLPCRHIFAFRAKKNLYLFTDEEVAQRWKLEFYARHSLAPFCAVDEVGRATSEGSQKTMHTIPIAEV